MIEIYYFSICLTELSQGLQKMILLNLVLLSNNVKEMRNMCVEMGFYIIISEMDMKKRSLFL